MAHTTCPIELMVSAKILAVETRDNENFWVQFVQGDQKIIAQQVAKWKKAKISTTKINLKAQNIYIKPLLKTSNTYNKPCLETAYLGENEINLLKQKVVPKVAIILGYFIL
jgi:hypothetical protein